MKLELALAAFVTVASWSLSGYGACPVRAGAATKATLDASNADVTPNLLDKFDCQPPHPGTTLQFDSVCVAKKLTAQADLTKAIQLALTFKDATKVPAAMQPCTSGATASIDLQIGTAQLKVTGTDAERALADPKEIESYTEIFDKDKWAPLPLEPNAKAARLLQAGAQALVLGQSKLTVVSMDASGAVTAQPPAPPSCKTSPPTYDSATRSFTFALPKDAANVAGLLPGQDCATTVSQDGKTISIDASCLAGKLVDDKGIHQTVKLPIATGSGTCESNGRLVATIELTTETVPAQMSDKPSFTDDSFQKNWSQVWVEKSWKKPSEISASALVNWALAIKSDGKTPGFLKLDFSDANSNTQRTCDSFVPREVTVPGPPPRQKKTINVAFWCPQAEGSDLLCIDMYCNGSTNLIVGPARNVLRPNRGVVVRIRHRKDRNVSVELGGERGLTQLGLANDKAGEVQRQSSEQPPPPADAVVTSFTFAPRKAGHADLTITSQKANESPQQQRLELEVESLSWGAARFGFAGLFGDIVGKTYEAQSVAGSKQAEIRRTKNPYFGWEVVVGLAPYVIDILACPGHGRSHTGGCNYRIAPYIGIGLIGQAPNGTSSFNSFHLGAEFEVAPSFSVAANAVWRGVDTLASGYAIGSAVETGTSFLQSKTAFGFAVVLNVSPGFLEFAVGQSGKESSSSGTSIAPAPATTPKADETKKSEGDAK